MRLHSLLALGRRKSVPSSATHWFGSSPSLSFLPETTMRYINEFFASDGFDEGLSVPPDASAVRSIAHRLLNELMERDGAPYRVAYFDSEEDDENPMQLAVVSEDDVDEQGTVDDTVEFFDTTQPLPDGRMLDEYIEELDDFEGKDGRSIDDIVTAKVVTHGDLLEELSLSLQGNGDSADEDSEEDDGEDDEDE